MTDLLTNETYGLLSPFAFIWIFAGYSIGCVIVATLAITIDILTNNKFHLCETMENDIY